MVCHEDGGKLTFKIYEKNDCPPAFIKQPVL
jgi:hypothetical protein